MGLYLLLYVVNNLTNSLERQSFIGFIIYVFSSTANENINFVCNIITCAKSIK